MGLPYENSTSGTGAIEEIRKILNRFGCQRFGVMTDNEKGELIIQFTFRDRHIHMAASFQGYAAAWLKEHPYKVGRMRRTRQDHERKALQQAELSVCSVLRDWIKGQITAIECGILSFEGAFLGQILLPNSGMTVLEEVQRRKLLPALTFDEE